MQHLTEDDLAMWIEHVLHSSDVPSETAVRNGDLSDLWFYSWLITLQLALNVHAARIEPL
ncbi:MAG: hypothetical protein R3E39_28005 [Anaerolineae bacterium]